MAGQLREAMGAGIVTQALTRGELADTAKTLVTAGAGAAALTAATAAGVGGLDYAVRAVANSRAAPARPMPSAGFSAPAASAAPTGTLAQMTVQQRLAQAYAEDARQAQDQARRQEWDAALAQQQANARQRRAEPPPTLGV